MSNNVLARQVRFFDLTRAFQAMAPLASDLEKAFGLAAILDDNDLTALETGLRGVAAKLDDPVVGEKILLLTSHPSAIPDAASEADKESNGGFNWVRTGARGAPAVRWDTEFHGMKLAVVKNGPGSYEGQINERKVTSSKFKAHVRDRVEKEATKRANA